MHDSIIRADGTLDIPALLAMHRRTFGDLRMEGEGGGAGDGSGGQGDGSGDGGGKWTPIASQEDFDARVLERVNRAKKAGYTEAEGKYKAGHDRHQALEQELASEKDKAVNAARDEERAKSLPRVVRAEFKAAAKGVLKDDQLNALLEDLDLSKYADDDGEPDEEKIAAKIAKFAPSKDDGAGSGRTVSLGQGQQQQSHAKPGDQGRAMAEKRFGTKKAS